MDRLETLRNEIDSLDAQLVELLARRFAVTDEVGQLKHTHALPAVDAEREARQAARITALAQEHGVDGELAWQVMRVIIDAVVRRHQAVSRERT
ncbi:chorismate mutase [Niveibacterium sp. SC-1]|uniref:chorismate mutase n=1 Tax=Niveibacterium sp. SC-1 TaxID=3135646 RepID=UPI00311DFDD0